MKQYAINLDRCLDKSAGIYSGKLVSNALDERIAKNDTIQVELDLIYQGKSKGIISFDEFLSHSISNFVHHQKDIIDAVEQALYNSFQRRDLILEDDIGTSFDGLKSPSAVWKYVTLKTCKFRIKVKPSDPKKVQELLNRFPGLSTDDFAGDDPSATSYYLLKFECQWEDEHEIDVEFRDDVCQGAFLE